MLRSDASPGLIGGLTLTPGLYKWTTAVSIGSDITMSGAAADSESTSPRKKNIQLIRCTAWIFQVTGTLTVANGVRMTLSGGAVAANIVWVVTDSITAGTTSHLEGVFLAKTSITLETGSTANSRLLAQTLVALQSVCDRFSISSP